MSAGLNNLKHIVVLMMGGRSFDHMLGSLKAQDQRIDGLTGNEANPDSTGAVVTVQPFAAFQGQLDPVPDHHFPAVDLQLFNGAQGVPRVPNMQGFIKSYFQERGDVDHSHNIMYYFTPDKLPVLTTLATEFAIFNGWFSSVPGPALPNQAFAHYGTSFGQIDMNLFQVKDSVLSIYERMIRVGHTAKIYYYDEQSSSLVTLRLLKDQPEIFATFSDFLLDCRRGSLSQYSFIEPNHNDHLGPEGEAILSSDQRPDHNVQAGEFFIASVYNAIRGNPNLWESTALLIVYDGHGGIYDHVIPPQCAPDGYVAPPTATGTGEPFAFDRLGIRVPAILVSPWVLRGTVVAGTEDPVNGRVFEHASIPATVSDFFVGSDNSRTVRERRADTFLGLLTDQLRSDDDSVVFDLGE
jgi:phospholipase C